MSNRKIEFIKKELFGWSKIEIVWIVIATLTILGLSLYWKESFIGICSALAGVVCVILTGKGKISSYIFGFINTLLYAYIAYNAKYYGEVMLNVLYYLPMNFVGWIMWKKHMDINTCEVKKERLNNKGRLLIVIICTISIYLYGLVLQNLGGSLPYIDSLSTVISIMAQILCVKRYMEQWMLWIVVNVVTVYMWIMTFFNGGESIATLIMWSVYLLNAIFMFIKWNRESKKNIESRIIEEVKNV